MLAAMTATLGVSLGDVVTVVEGESRTNASVGTGNYLERGAVDRASDTPAPPGAIPLSVSVSVVYRLGRWRASLPREPHAKHAVGVEVVRLGHATDPAEREAGPQRIADRGATLRKVDERVIVKADDAVAVGERHESRFARVYGRPPRGGGRARAPLAGRRAE